VTYKILEIIKHWSMFTGTRQFKRPFI